MTVLLFLLLLLLLLLLLIVIVVVAIAIVIITTDIITIIIRTVAAQSAGLARWRDLPQAAESTVHRRGGDGDGRPGHAGRWREAQLPAVGGQNFRAVFVRSPRDACT